MFKWSLNKSYKFVLHQHDAKRAGRHYDLRILRDDGNVESFATRKDPTTMKSGDKRLLIKQPLHDKYWLTFQGEIEKGYGTGTLKIKDKGTAKVIKLDDRYVTFEFNGKKLKGKYAIVHTGGNNFLLVKSKK